MVLPTTGSAGRVITLPLNVNSTSAAANATDRKSPVTLDPLALCTSGDFRVAMFGTPRQVDAAMALMQREVTIQIEECYTQLGETDRNVVGRTHDFIVNGHLPEEFLNEDMFARVAELNAADTQQSRESRIHTVFQAGMDWLEAAKGPGLNLLNIVGRTGLIVALTTVLRQVVSYHVEQALREGDTPEATRAWLVAAQVMTGPALILAGAIRNECGGMAKLSSRLGRICMASITMGAFLMAHLTGASKDLLPSMTGVTIYTLARGLANAFFTLPDNAGPSNVRATAVTTAAYGAAQFVLAELGRLLPLTGAARSATELGYSLVADLMQGGLNSLGIVIDDSISILCKSWQVLSPSRGLDSVFSDPESLQQMVLKVRAGFQVPNRSQLADALLNVGALRLSAGHAISLVVAAVAALLSDSEVGEDNQGHILNGCLAMMLMLIYFPLVFGCVRRTDNTYALEETAVP